MSINEIKAKVTELKELKAMQEELANEINAIENELKAAMGDQEQIVAGAFKITWKTVTTSRLDSAALKKALPEIAAKFMKQTTSKRFCIN
jgi:predicted phage-related endonuclease